MNYEELEHIESTGTQWIETDIIPTGLTIETDMSFTSYVNESSLFGVMCVSPSYRYYVTQYYNNLLIGSGTFVCEFGGSSIRPMHIVFNDSEQRVLINGAVYVTQFKDSEAQSYPFWIFRRNRIGVQMDPPACAILRSMTLTDKSDGVLRYDFRPCRRVSDGAIGMYDTVNAQFYTNSGTGQFVAGPPTGKHY